MVAHVRTYQSRLKGLTPEQLTLLDQYAGLFGQVEHTLYADLMKGASAGQLKPAYCRRFGITARQFNGVWFTLKGKIQSVQEGMKQRLGELKARIEKAAKVIQALHKKQKAGQSVDFPLHHKKRRLVTLKHRQRQLQRDIQAGKVRLCFGGKKRFRAQFHLAENGYASFEEWKADWQQARSSQFFCLGSKDETAGNQSCSAQYLTGNRFRFRLRWPAAICAGQPVHTTFEAEVAYGAETIRAVLEQGGAISYRFVKDAKGWRIFISLQAPQPQEHSRRALGATGIDLNSDHLAVAQVNRHGNGVKATRIPFVTYGCSPEQTQARIGEAVKAVIEIAAASATPLVIEKLDFARKKAQLESSHPRAARMLSSLAYAQIIHTLKARAYDAGIEVLEVNPAYTSVIGTYKFQSRYGLSSHQSAAVAIARRGMKLSERPNRRMETQVAFPLPARNRRKHVWSFWRQVALKAAALAAHRRSVANRSRGSPSGTLSAINPSMAGGIPARESLAALFG